MTDWTDMLGDMATSAAKGAAAGSIVPGIGTVVGGLAGLASSLVPHIFGADATPVLAAAAKVITGVDDEAAQVQILSTDTTALAAYKIEALKIAGDREQARLDAQSNDITARLADVANARNQTQVLAAAGSPLAWGSSVISLVVTVGFFGAFGLLIYGPVPADNGQQAMLNILTGALSSAFAAVVGYWIGSSSGSRGKDTTIAQLAAAPARSQ